MTTSPPPLSVLLLPHTALIGACVGSFVNVLVYRLPRGIPFAKDISKCPACGSRIRPYDLIPILSFIILHGRCRDCKASVSLCYPLVESAAGVLAVAAVLLFGFSAAAVLYFAVHTVLLTIALIDWEHMIIPDGLVAALGFLAIAHTALFWQSGGFGMTSRIAGFFAISAPMCALALLIKDAFGGGDIKLIAVCGFLLGLKLTLFAAFAAFLLGGVHAVYILIFKKHKGVTHIPFGQYICIGVFIASIWGESLVNVYLSLFL